ncbi:MAG: hypothetical protein IPM42_20650 [Saprospiraceae bacterium]|nr:hypothetical protein [Saprospiraceae bacterium]
MANIINSKNESKSQLVTTCSSIVSRCGKYHKFKERKQITTYFFIMHTQNGCGKYHKFKERKQITTWEILLAAGRTLWQIS